MMYIVIFGCNLLIKEEELIAALLPLFLSCKSCTKKKHLDSYQGVVISSKLSESAPSIKGLISPTL